MPNLQKYPAKICYTAAALLIHDHKVLLVKHRKLGVWLAPGGHIELEEKNELPHQAAEREFWEETGVKVKVYDPFFVRHSDLTEHTPLPIECNLHWVSEENYLRRQKDPVGYTREIQWKKGCEQHYGFLFLVKPVGSLDFKQNEEETDGIAWFGLDELDDLETYQDIRDEIRLAFKIIEKNPVEFFLSHKTSLTANTVSGQAML